MKKISIFTAMLLLIAVRFYGQQQERFERTAFAIDTLYKTNYKNGDTLTIRVRNLAKNKQSFSLTAVADVDDAFYFNQMYSACFNMDSSFFKEIKEAKVQAAKNKAELALPRVSNKVYNLAAEESTVIRFALKGKPLKDGVPLQLRIRPIRSLDGYTGITHSDVVMSTPFTVFFSPE